MAFNADNTNNLMRGIEGFFAFTTCEAGYSNLIWGGIDVIKQDWELKCEARYVRHIGNISVYLFHSVLSCEVVYILKIFSLSSLLKCV